MNTVTKLQEIIKLAQEALAELEDGKASKGRKKLTIVTEHVSPNYSARVPGVKIDTIVLHNTDGKISGSISWFKNTASRVSAHYLIARDGTIYKMVPEPKKAWHARQENSRSIGIEIEAHQGATGMTQVQNESLVDLISDIKSRHDIERIVCHRDVVNTDCPKWVWPNNDAFNRWKESYL